jgi:cellobiose dehydrogenase (acceptor)
MVYSLLLMAWPYQGQVLTSFRFITDYFMPDVYGGNATLTQISSWVNSTGYEVTYRCQNCMSWDQDGNSGAVQTSQANDVLVLGRAQAADGPTSASCPHEIAFGFHNNGYGEWGAGLENITSPSYSAWAALATQTVLGSCGAASTQAPAHSETHAPAAAPVLI